MSDIPTPESDAASNILHKSGGGVEHVCSRTFARTLERRLAVAVEALSNISIGEVGKGQSEAVFAAASRREATEALRRIDAMKEGRDE